MAFDVARVRAEYPALGDGRVWLDGAAGTQVPASVIEAVTGVYRRGLGNQGATFDVSRRLGMVVDQARRAVAELVRAPDPAGVVLGPSMTALTYRFAAGLAGTWRAGDEIVLTELDHEANIAPWRQAADRAGVRVRTAPIDRDTGTLPTAAVADLLGERTRLVAFSAASNLLGTIPDVTAIAEAARQVDAVSYVDGVHHCPHADVDVAALAVDLYVTSAYKWYGPHVAAVVAARPQVLEGIAADNLVARPDGDPVRFELGTNPFPALAGVAAAVEHVTGLEGRLTHERRLGELMLDGLRAVPGVELLPGADGAGSRRTPTASFRVRGRHPVEVAAALDRAGVNVWHGHAYARGAAEALGIADGGVVRASVNHYNDDRDIARLVAAVSEYASGRGPR